MTKKVDSISPVTVYPNNDNNNNTGFLMYLISEVDVPESVKSRERASSAGGLWSSKPQMTVKLCVCHSTMERSSPQSGSTCLLIHEQSQDTGF